MGRAVVLVPPPVASAVGPWPPVGAVGGIFRNLFSKSRRRARSFSALFAGIVTRPVTELSERPSHSHSREGVSYLWTASLKPKKLKRVRRATTHASQLRAATESQRRPDSSRCATLARIRSSTNASVLPPMLRMIHWSISVSLQKWYGELLMPNRATFPRNSRCEASPLPSRRMRWLHAAPHLDAASAETIVPAGARRPRWWRSSWWTRQ